ncbi:MAG: GAF domain-containing protein [Pleurocapsa minor GSE-CHR-MK-17-07R]|jgi:PAS domain S-box-containing protein|nr:GAF domain-containing protein [Pleurocapsa minor GSE-CHR-MK 17-07R]
MGLPLILIIGGILILVWLFLWVRQRQDIGGLPVLESDAQELGLFGASTNDAMIVASAAGQILFVNEQARRLFGAVGIDLSLEGYAALVTPSDSFLELFAGAGQAAFQVGGHWIEATSNQIPGDKGARTVVMLRETRGMAGSDTLDLNKAVQVVAEIGETVNVSLGIEQSLQALLTIVRKYVPADAGEITLWDSVTETLTPRGYVGDSAYVLQLAESGGHYSIDEGISGWIAALRVPVLVHDGSAPDAVRPKLANSPYRSFIGVPLLQGDRLIGTFELASTRVGGYANADLALLQAIARPIATSIYNAEIYAEQQRRMQDVASLQQVSYDPLQPDTIAEAYGEIVERVAKLTGAEMCGVLIYDERRRLLIPQSPYYGLPDAVVRTYTIPVSEGTRGAELFYEEDSWYTNDLTDEPSLDALGMTLLANIAGVANTALVPLIVGSRRIGMLQLNNKRAQGGFSLRDIANLKLLAGQVSVVVEDIRLGQQEQQRETELSGVQEITQALGAFTREQEFFASANERMARLLGVQSCGILLFDEAEQALVARPPFYGQTDAQVADYRIRVDEESPFWRIWSSEDTWLTNSADTDRMVLGSGLRVPPVSNGTTRLVIAVMETAGRRVGLVQAANKLNGTDFTEKDARLLYIFAAQVASLIENSRLFIEAQRRAEEADSLRQIAELSGAILSTEDSFLPVLGTVARFLDAEAVFINVLDQASGKLVTYPRYLYGVDLAEPIEQNIYSKGFEHSVAISRQSFWSNDVLGDRRVLPSYRELAERMGIRQAMMVPLVVGDQTLGEMGVMNSRRGGFGEDDVRSLMPVAVQVAAALDRIRIYETTGQNLSRRLQELDAISRVSSELAQTLDFMRVLDVARLESVRATDADGNTLALLKPASEWRDPSVPELQQRIGDRLAGPPLADIELAAIRAGTDAVIVADYAASEMKAPASDARSGLAAAFTYEDQIVGVFHLYHHQPNYFDQRAATFLMTLASKASLGYGNNLRYLENQDRSSRLRRRVEQLNQIFELGQMLQTSVDPVTMLEAIAYSVQQSCGYDAVIMTLLDTSEGDPQFVRLAQAGLPLDIFEKTRARRFGLKAFEVLAEKDAYRISESFFLPIEKLRYWMAEGLDTFSASYSGQRTLHPSSGDDWQDGDLLIVPIRGATGAVLGAMSLDRPADGRRPDRSMIEVLEIFAHQAASTIENNRLYMASLRSAEQEARLNEVMEAISSTLELNQIVEGVAQGVLRLLPFQRMTLALVDNEQQGFDLIRVSVTSDNSIVVGRDRRASLDNTAMGQTLSSGADLVLYADDAPSEFEDVRSWVAEGERTTLVVPMVSGGFVLGAMHIGSTLDHAFGFEEFRPLIRRIANLTAVAAQNARLFNQAVNLRLFNESVFQSIQQGLIVLDRSGAILTANDFVRRRYGFTDEVTGRNLFDVLPQLSDVLRAPFKSVIDDAKPQDIGAARIMINGGALVQNYSIYPLLSNDFARGAVVLVDDVTERARLERDIAARSSQLEALTEVSSRITAALQRNEVIDLALEELNRVIGYDAMTIWRREGDDLVIEAARGLDLSDNEPMRVPIDDSKKLRRVVENRRVLSMAVNANDSLLGTSLTKSWLGVPLVRSGAVMGMITLSSAQPDFYDQQAEQAAVAFANQVAIALSNADMFEEAAARTQRLSLLNRVSMALAQSLDVENILDISLREIAGALGIEHAKAFLFDRDTSQARAVVEMPRGDAPPDLIYDIDKSPIMQRVWKRPQVLVVEDIDDLEDAELELELLKRGCSSYLLLPMSVGGQSSGAFELLAFGGPHTFDPEKIDLAVIIASQAAIAILNANLLEQTLVRTRELETLLEAAQATSTTLDLNEVFQSVVRLTMQALNVDDCALMLYDNVGERLIVQLDGNRFDDDSRVMPFGTEIDLFQYPSKTRAIRDNQIQVIDIDNPTSGDRRELEEMRQMGDTCRMLVPLFVGDGAIGMIQIDTQSPVRRFDHREMRMAQALASQAAAAIENARLSTETSSQVAQSLIINELSRAISSTMDLNQMIEIIREQVPLLTNANELYLALYDAASGMVSFPLYLVGSKKMVMESRPLSNDEVSYVIRNRRPLMLGGDNPRPDEVRRNMGITEGELGITRYIGVPLAAGDMVAGVLAARDTEPVRPFGLNDQRIMTTIGAQLGAMIQNSNLLNRVQNFAAELNDRVQERTVELQIERDRMATMLQSEREEAEKNSAILEGIADGVLLCDADGVAILMNTAAERILELPRAAVIGHPLAEFSEGPQSAWVSAISNYVLNPPRAAAGRLVEDFVADRLDIGRRIVNIRASAVFNGDQFLGTVSLFRDVTKDVEVDRMKSEFISNVSHELRTPMTSIKGYADLLLMGGGGSVTPDQERFLQTIKSNADRLAELVNDLLNISKIDAGSEQLVLTRVDVREMVEQAVSFNQGRVEFERKHLTVTTTFADDLPLVNADRLKMMQIVSNVIDNAFNYTYPNGHVSIDARYEAARAGVLITVQDDGIGIAEEFKSRIWNRFERYDAHALVLDVAGTGLGLSIVKHMVDLHHGEVWFDSEPGKGSTFYILIPVDGPDVGLIPSRGEPSMTTQES